MLRRFTSRIAVSDTGSVSPEERTVPSTLTLYNPNTESCGLRWPGKVTTLPVAEPASPSGLTTPLPLREASRYWRETRLKIVPETLPLA